MARIFYLMPFRCFSMDSPRSWSPKFYQDDVLVFIFGFSMLSYGSIPVIVSTYIILPDYAPGKFLSKVRNAMIPASINGARLYFRGGKTIAPRYHLPMGTTGITGGIQNFTVQSY